LGQEPVIRAAFAAQAQQRTAATAELSSDDAHAIMARHAEPLQAPQQAGAAPGGKLGQVPQLGILP
jgi:hypothetical protein